MLPIVGGVTYLQFLAIFLAAPIVALLAIWRGRLRSLPWAAIGGLSLVALVYTAPWDNFLIASGVWSYPASRVLPVHVGMVPVEECAFFVLQTILASLVTLRLVGNRPT